MQRVYKITDPDLPEELHTVRDVFNGTIKEAAAEPKEDTRQPGEGLHDYFMRKGIKCFCNICRSKKNDGTDNSDSIVGSTTSSNI